MSDVEINTAPSAEGSKLPALSPGWDVHTVALIAITTAGALLRFSSLGRESLWYDEAFSAWYTTLSLSELWGQVPIYEVHPPLYGILLKAWTSVFGDSEAGLRSMSAIAGVMTIPLVYLLGRLAFGPGRGRATGLFAAALAAFSPLHLMYGQEARPYALLTLAAVIAMCGALWLAANPALAARPWFGAAKTVAGWDIRPTAAWMALIFGCGLAVWSHNLGALLLITLLVVVFPTILWNVKGSLPFIVNTILAACAMVAIWSPFLPLLVIQTPTVKGHFWLKSISIGQFSHGMNHIFALHFPSWSFIYFVFALAVAGLWTLGRERGFLAAYSLGGLFVVPLLIIVGVSHFFTPLFLPRTFIWISMPFYVALAAGLNWANERFGGMRIPILAITAFCFLWGDYRYFTLLTKEPWREMAIYLDKGGSSPNVALVISGSAAIPLNYYSRRLNLKLDVRPLPVLFPAPFLDRSYPWGVADPAIKSSDIGMVADLPCDTSTIWLVTRGGSIFDPESIIYNHLAGRCDLLEGHQRELIKIFRFGKKTPSTDGAPGKKSP